MNESAHIGVLCVDDHPLFREGIAAVIESQEDMYIAGMAATGVEAIAVHRSHRPDVTLMDLRLPDMSGVAALTAIRTEYRAANIIMLTTFEGDVQMQRALAAGARGYILKSTPLEELTAVIREVYRGRKYLPPAVAQQIAEHVVADVLSEREVEVLTQMATGSRNREIGETLSISEETVKAHVRHILEKLGAKDRTQAVAIGLRRGFIQL